MSCGHWVLTTWICKVLIHENMFPQAGYKTFRSLSGSSVNMLMSCGHWVYVEMLCLFWPCCAFRENTVAMQLLCLYGTCCALGRPLVRHHKGIINHVLIHLHLHHHHHHHHHDHGFTSVSSSCPSCFMSFLHWDGGMKCPPFPPFPSPWGLRANRRPSPPEAMAGFMLGGFPGCQTKEVTTLW